MRKFLLVFTFIFGLVSISAQNNDSSEYLLNKKFPDSITGFQINDINGKKVSLKDVLEKHKGHKIVIDFWASWCKQCIKGMPSLQTLQKETDGKKIDYIFISLDEISASWKSAIVEMDIRGDHYIMNIGGWENKNILTKFIKLEDIPRYMILDEEGVIIFSKTLKASDPKFREILLK